MSRLGIFTTALALTMTVAASGSAAPTIDPARLSEHIRILAGDDYQGRGPATPAEAKTTAYISGQFASVGLAPGGERGTWLQDVPLLRSEISTPPVTTIQVAGTTLPLDDGPQIAIRAPQMLLTSVAQAKLPMVFVGYGVVAPERGWDDYKGADLTGKIAVALINDPDFEAQPGEPAYGKFDGRAMTFYGRWDYKYAEAARHHAAGLLIVHETEPAAYGWATVRNSNTIAMFDIVRPKPEDVHPVIEAWITRDVAADLMQRAKLSLDALKVRARSDAFTPVPIGDATFSTAFTMNASEIVTHNVLGILRGTTRPNDVLLYSAHWDHLGIGPPDAHGDTIYHGALDNASGVASLVELARAFVAGPRPARSVVFMATTAEEKGLLGALYYGMHPVYPIATTVADLNIDGINATGPTHDVSMSGNPRMTLVKMLADAAHAQGRVFVPDAHPETGGFFRNDSFSLVRVGIPALTIKSGLDQVNGGTAAGEAARVAYTRDRYHQPADVWERTWNLDGAVQDLTLYLTIGHDLANAEVWPTWEAGSEFKATRDATADARR